MTDVPLPGSTVVAPVARLLVAQLDRCAVERVVAAELVAHLVGDVVDGEEVADRVGEAGAAAPLDAPADDADAGDAAAA